MTEIGWDKDKARALLDLRQGPDVLDEAGEPADCTQASQVLLRGGGEQGGQVHHLGEERGGRRS